MKTPHKYAELIKAWADGEKIQVFSSLKEWVDAEHPSWLEELQYRIKPESKPDLIKYVRTNVLNNDICRWDSCNASYANLRITFDGETGDLKDAQVLK